MNRCTLILALGILFLNCKKEGTLFSTPESDETGIAFSNDLTESDDLNILDYLYFYNGGGIALGDINNDGLPDVFFSGNQVKNKLYLNKGGLQFEDITDSAGVAGNASWNTGSTMADVNGDGWLDIYVCAVVGINGFNGFNELYINNGDGTFTESAATYGLDFDSYSSNAAFFDYDLDGDLDMYLLNHAVHTQNSFGHADLRLDRNYETGDKLLRNDNGKFVDVSEAAGIFGGINSYGRGLAISDFDQDGDPDIYVGNDFHEDDYYYVNNGDGTFTEGLRDHFGHTSRFSMGNDVADINNDGLPDLISLDMLPESEIALKSSEGDDNIQTQKLRIERYGYHYQFTRNMLFVNQPDGRFMETALMSGVAATDWSWSALFGDYDQDGQQDLFVSNGIPKRPNDLDFIKFVSSEQIKNKISNTKLVDQQALELMPAGNVHNYVFKGEKGFAFSDMSDAWIKKDTLLSGATAMGDLDGDGDIDLIANNLNRTPTLYVNKTNEKANYLKLRFNYKAPNTFGIGTKVFAYADDGVQFKELFPSRGFQATSEPMIHFGLGRTDQIDSLKIIWPDNTFKVLRELETNQTLTLDPQGSAPLEAKTNPKSPMFELVQNDLGIDFRHEEDNYSHFNREKLIPYQVSDRGPAVAYGDLNGDGKEDLFFGGSKFKPSQIYLQADSSYVRSKITAMANDSIKEEVAALITDLNGDGRNDLFIGTGGSDFFGKARALIDSYYQGQDSSFTKQEIPEYFENVSVVKAFDFDGDGDQDLFIGCHSATGKFGQKTPSYLLRNDEGRFSIHQKIESERLGMVTDALWDDFDKDGTTDLIIVGEWMSPLFLKNLQGTFKETSDLRLNGLWQGIHPFDIDGDGDTDYLLGNWGTNSKFKASKRYPLKLLYADFDENGQTETVTVFEKEGQYYTLEGLDGLASQLVFLRKKFNAYREFAGEPVERLFEKDALQKATTLEVDELRSGFLRNQNGVFRFEAFPETLQVAPLLAFVTADFDGDGDDEVLVGGNYFGVKPYHGRFDSFAGALIENEGSVISGSILGLDFTQKSLRHLTMIGNKEKQYLLATFNDDKAQVYRLTTK